MSQIVAIVGRPNVGKSTLFNRPGQFCVVQDLEAGTLTYYKRSLNALHLMFVLLLALHKTGIIRSSKGYFLA